MAYFGIYSAGVAVTASEANDTVKFSFKSSQTLTSNSVLGLDGDDIIYLGTQGQLTTASATHNALMTGVAPASGTFTGDIVTTQLFGSAGTVVASGSTAVTTGVNDVQVIAIVTSQQAIRTFNKSNLYGNAGNDTIAFGANLTTVTASTFGGGAGDDFMGVIRQVSAGAAPAITNQSGAGTWTTTFIEGGGGADTVSIDSNAIALNLSASTVQGSLGADSIFLRTNGTLQGTQLLGGGNNDTITALASAGATAVTIAGGGGNDSLMLTIGANGSNSNLILGDALNSISEYDDGDLINVQMLDADLFSASTIQAGGGSDTVNIGGSAINADGAAGILVQLQAGNDTFTATTGNVSAVTIEAGAGNDAVYFASGADNSLVKGGGGNDTVTFGHSVLTTNAYNTTTVYGGAGSDLFTQSAGNDLGNVAHGIRFAYETATESTLSAMDTIEFGGGNGSTFALRYEGAALALANFATASTNGTAIATANNGVVSFENDGASSLTARVEFLDANLTAARVAVFNNSNNNREYLFIQGGASGGGIGDDLVVQLGTAGSVTGSTVTLAADSKSFTYAPA